MKIFQMIRLVLVILLLSGSALSFAQNATQLNYVLDFCEDEKLDLGDLMELEALRSSEKGSEASRQKKWNKKYAKWDRNGAMQKVNLAQLLLAPYDIGEDNYFRRKEYSGTSHNSLKSTLEEIYVASEKNRHFYAFVQTALAVQPDTSATLLQADISRMHGLVDDMQMNGLFSDENFASIVSFYDNLTGLTPHEIDALPMDSFRMEAFDAFMSEKGLFPHSMFYSGAPGISLSMDYAISSAFLFGLTRGLPHVINLGESEGDRIYPRWPEDMASYDNFMDIERFRNIVIAQSILQKYLRFRGEKLLKECNANDWSLNVWHNLHDLDLNMNRTTSLRLQLGAKKIENQVERLLLLAANGVYMMPTIIHRYGFLRTVKTDVEIFRLNELERTIINGIGEFGMSISAQKLVCGHPEIIEKLHQSEHFRHALNVKYAQMALVSKRNCYYQPFDAYKLDREYRYVPSVDGGDDAARKKENEIVSSLKTILVDNGFKWQDYIIDYDGIQAMIYPTVNWKAESAFRKLLKEKCALMGLELRYFRFYVPKDFSSGISEGGILENQKEKPVRTVPPPPSIRENESVPPKVAVTPPPPPVPPDVIPTVKAEIIDFPDVEASFPGGMGAFKKYLEDNMVYPETAIELGEQGKVYLSFVVEPDGTITNVKVERGVSKDLDREAKRLIRASPKWIPGESHGKKIRTKCRFPVVFILPD